MQRWRPMDSKIATSILDSVSGIPEIWIIDTVTGAARRMFAGPSLSVFPVWSPDSQKLAYGRGIPGSDQGFSSEALGTTKKRRLYLRTSFRYRQIGLATVVL